MVGIVILNFNNSCATKKCLESIIEYESSDKYKICLVDNSTDTVDRPRTMENVDDLRRKEPLADIHVILLKRMKGMPKGIIEALNILKTIWTFLKFSFSTMTSFSPCQYWKG